MHIHQIYTHSVPSQEFESDQNTRWRGHAWKTVHLHAGGHFSLLQMVRALALQAAANANHIHSWFPLTMQQLSVRTMELHTVSAGGHLGASILPFAQAPVIEHHFDAGSTLTVDFMLARNFSGGNFHTVSKSGRTTLWDFELGDALVFISEAYHGVQRVQGGSRQTLVVELWTGEECTESGRCMPGDATRDCHVHAATMLQI